MSKHPVRKGRTILALAISSLIGFPAAGASEPALLPPTLAAALLGRVAAYERNLASRSGPVVAAVVATGPEGYADEAAGALREIGEVAGRPLRVFAVVAGPDAVARLEALRAEMVFSPACPPAVAPAIATFARVRKILAVGGEPACLDVGIGLVLLLEDERPRVVVDVEATRAAGLALDAGLLRLARRHEARP